MSANDTPSHPLEICPDCDGDLGDVRYITLKRYIKIIAYCLRCKRRVVSRDYGAKVPSV